MDNVDQRKVKKDGRARAEKANKSLENYQRHSQAELQQKEHRGPIFHGHRLSCLKLTIVKSIIIPV